MKKVFWIGIILKIFAGITLGLIYQFYYQNPKSDTFLYFQDAATLSQRLLSHPQTFFSIVFQNDFTGATGEHYLWFSRQPRALLMSEIICPVVLLGFRNYWLTSILLSIFSFSGIWQLVKTLSVQYPERKIQAIAAFLIFPSVVFWSSGIMKETVVIGCLGWSLSFLFDTKSITWVKWMVILASTLVIAGLKYYNFAVIVPVLTAYFLTKKLTILYLPKKETASVVLFFCTLSVFAFIASFLHPNLRPDNFLQALIKNHDIMLQNSEYHNAIHYTNLKPDWLSILQNVPLALISGLFRPFVWECRTLLQAITGIENLVILCCMAWTSYRLVKREIIISDFLLVVAVCTFIILSATLLALSSPNLGTLARYKVIYLPFLLYFILPYEKRFDM
jgi:uncharacterized membrane protein YqaE (UPF0057 family)